MNTNTIRISKSKFVAGVQCLKRLYLEVHQPELAGELDEATKAVMEQGHQVGQSCRPESISGWSDGRGRTHRACQSH